MRREHRRTTRRTRIRILGAVLIASAIVWGTVALTSVLQGTDTETPVIPTSDPIAEDGASFLVAVTNDEDDATSIALVTAAEQSVARVVLFPPSLLATLPGFGENTLSNTTRFDGVELLEVTVANLLGTRIDASVALAAGDLDRVVQGDLVVDLAEPLFEPDGDGQVVVMGQGESARSIDEIVRLMTDPGGDDELTWLTRQGDVWEAMLAGGASEPDLFRRMAADAIGDGEAALGVLSAAGESAVLTVVPAIRIEPTGGEERYQLSGEIAADFVADSFAYLRIGEEPRDRVEVLNGNGQIGSTRPVAGTLIRQGYRVILTDNADRLDYADTRIIAHGREHQQAALSVREIIGRGEVSVEVRQPSGVVDVTIIVGRDLAADGG